MMAGKKRPAGAKAPVGPPKDKQIKGAPIKKEA